MEPPVIRYYNMGGTRFAFAQTTLEKAHVKDSAFASSVKYSQDIPYYEVDPLRFDKWCCPYIRYGRLPAPEALTCPQERNIVIDTANILGLIALAQYVSDLNAPPKEKPRQTVRFKVTKDHNVTCPDTHCAKYVTDFITHLFLEHKAKVSLLKAYKDGTHYYLVKCKMADYKP